MTRQIMLHQLNATGVEPAEFVRIAADAGCRRVTMFAYDGSDVLPRSNSGLSYPVPITAESKEDVRRALDETGVALDGVEFFPLVAEVDFELYRPAMELGRELGANRAVSHIFIEDDALVVERLGQLAELVNSIGLRLTSEFCPLTAGNPSLERARWLVDQIGSDRFGIGVDVLHLIRSGGTPADVAALDERYFGVVQICDAIGAHPSNDYIKDVHNREVPGQGDLPIREFLNAVPAGMPIEAEVPAAHRRAAGISAAQHCREVFEAASAIAERLEPVR
jgi:sugar phosphate isomerase/epimerase